MNKELVYIIQNIEFNSDYPDSEETIPITQLITPDVNDVKQFLQNKFDEMKNKNNYAIFSTKEEMLENLFFSYGSSSNDFGNYKTLILRVENNVKIISINEVV